MPSFLKPAWVKHDGFPIFSVDIQPDGTRLASGGGDNKINIWNLLPLQDEAAQKDPNIPKRLATMTNHLGAVNCVRWSNSGLLLASGSDDNLAIIWQRDEAAGGQRVFGEPDSAILPETWRPIWFLREHKADVSDVAWSPDDTLLATASFDNNIYIWDLTKKAQIQVLKNHTSLVKGICFDPVGKFLASQSDDKRVIIWRVSDWKVEAEVSKYFKKNTERDFFRRLSWSPDGSFVATTNAFTDLAPVSALLVRNTWTKQCDFVGHRKPVSATRFSSVMFEVKDKKGLDVRYCCCAVGSMDCGFSVWATNSPRPIFVATSSFGDSVVDLSWSSNGRSLVVCSSDGSLAYVEFTDAEIGLPMNKERQRRIMRETYGTVTKSALIENPFQLQLEASSLTRTQSQNPPTAISSSSKASTSQSITEQKETTTRDGRRRIQPVVLNQPSPSFPIIRANSFASPMDVVVPINSTAFSTPIMEPEKAGDKSSPPITNGGPITTITTLNDDEDGVSFSHPPSPRTAESTKRKRPSSPAEPPKKTAKHDNKEKERDHGKSSKEREKEKVKSREREREKEKQRDKGKSKGSNSTSDRDRHSKDKHHRRDKETEKDRSSRRKDADRDRDFERDRSLSRSTSAISVAVSTQRLAPALPAVKLTTQLQSSPDSTNRFIEATVSETEALTMVKMIHGEKVQWEDQVRAKACLLTANDTFSALAFTDNSLQIYSSSGRRLMPAIHCGCPFFVLSCNSGDKLLAVLTDATVLVWNIEKQTLLLSHSLGSLVNPPQVTLEKAQITESGQAIIQLSNYESYAFHEGMKAWLRIADNKFVGSEFASLLPRFGGGTVGILQQLQEKPERRGDLSLLTRMNGKQNALETRAHLENQIACAIAVGSSSEYRSWLQNYVQFLAQEADSGRLEEVCSFLLGPYPTQPDWDPAILRYPKRQLLQELLPVISSNRLLQRLAAKYRENLSTIEEELVSQV